MTPKALSRRSPSPVARPRELYADGPVDWQIYDYLLADVEGYDLSDAEKDWINAWDDWVKRFRHHNPGEEPHRGSPSGSRLADDRGPGDPDRVGELDDVPPGR